MAEAVERAKLNRRLFLQLSAASLAAGGLHVALERPALAEVPDPASEDPDLIIIDGLTEAANDPDVQQYIRTGALPFWIAGMFVNVWRTNLDFISVPPDLADYYRRAGGAYRDLAGRAGNLGDDSASSPHGRATSIAKLPQHSGLEPLHSPQHGRRRQRR